MFNARKRSEDKPATRTRDVNWTRERELRRTGHTAFPPPPAATAAGYRRPVGARWRRGRMAALSTREPRSVCVSWRGRRRRYPSFSIAATACFRTSDVRAPSQLIPFANPSRPTPATAVSSVAFLYRRTIRLSLSLSLSRQQEEEASTAAAFSEFVSYARIRTCGSVRDSASRIPTSSTSSSSTTWRIAGISLVTLGRHLSVSQRLSFPARDPLSQFLRVTLFPRLPYLTLPYPTPTPTLTLTLTLPLVALRNPSTTRRSRVFTIVASSYLPSRSPLTCTPVADRCPVEAAEVSRRLCALCDITSGPTAPRRFFPNPAEKTSPPLPESSSSSSSTSSSSSSSTITRVCTYRIRTIFIRDRADFASTWSRSSCPLCVCESARGKKIFPRTYNGDRDRTP